MICQSKIKHSVILLQKSRLQKTSGYAPPPFKSLLLLPFKAIPPIMSNSHPNQCSISLTAPTTLCRKTNCPPAAMIPSEHPLHVSIPETAQSGHSNQSHVIQHDLSIAKHCKLSLPSAKCLFQIYLNSGISKRRIILMAAMQAEVGVVEVESALKDLGSCETPLTLVWLFS